MTVEKVEQSSDEQVTKAQFEELMSVVKVLKEENKVLKAHADETIQEKRALKAKHEEEKANLDKQLEEKVNRSKDENEQLLKQYKEQNDNLKKDIDSFKQREYENKVNNKAQELASKLNPLNDVAAKTLAKELKNRIKLDDDGTLKVLDEAGNVTISPVDQLVSEFGTSYAFMCKGVESTGGGSHSSVSTQPQKKFSELNEVERRDLYTKDVSKYRELRLQETVK
jgi:DNA repair exonuclease SbcCD ATPase subunit